MNTSTPSVKTTLAQAVEIAAPGERQAFVEQACAGDAARQHRVERLIANHFQAGNFLERPAVAMDPDETAGWEPARSAEGPGTVIGPYKLLEQIGEGGMGLVYVADQQHPIKRRVALKIIKPGMDSRQVVARFEAEMRRIIREEEPPKPSTRLSSLGDALTTVSANRKADARQLDRTVRGELDWIVMKIKPVRKSTSRTAQGNTNSAATRAVSRFSRRSR